jgi:hypothetical protein
LRVIQYYGVHTRPGLGLGRYISKPDLGRWILKCRTRFFSKWSDLPAEEQTRIKSELFRSSVGDTDPDYVSPQEVWMDSQSTMPVAADFVFQEKRISEWIQEVTTTKVLSKTSAEVSMAGSTLCSVAITQSVLVRRVCSGRWGLLGSIITG